MDLIDLKVDRLIFLVDWCF